MEIPTELPGFTLSDTNTKTSLYSLTLDELRKILVDNSLAKYAADQIYNWVYKQLILDPEKWSNVSKKIKQFLKENYHLELPQIIANKVSTDGTRKFLFQLYDGESIESVVIPAKNRLTLCVSSQVGCAIGCTFCHTGTMGFKRHLSAGEVVGQYLAAAKWLTENSGLSSRLTNLVYMGQGEPLHNYENIKKATIIFLEDKGIGFGQRKITLSTSGLVPQIKQLWNFPLINIAISLHAAHDNIRSELMPINKTYDLRRLFAAIKEIPLKGQRRITYEYLLIKDLNDRIDDIDGLIELLDRKHSKLNIIPFNEYPQSSFKRPSTEKIVWFQNELINKGFTCTIRNPKGDDILAACGQLKSSTLPDAETNQLPK